MIAKMATYRIKPDKKGRVLAIVEEFVMAVRDNEPKTLRYVAYQQADGVSFLHIMYFKDEKAEQVHREAKHTRRFTELLHPMCEEEPVFTDIEPIPSFHM